MRTVAVLVGADVPCAARKSHRVMGYARLQTTHWCRFWRRGIRPRSEPLDRTPEMTAEALAWAA
jgi:hypothetical protein